jgi:tetratricopeptide (TPR) repeat protein
MSSTGPSLLKVLCLYFICWIVQSPLHATDFSSFDENGQMKIGCEGGGLLSVEKPLRSDDVAIICWTVGRQKNCQKANAEIMLGLMPVTLNCNRSSAHVSLPVSTNYLVSHHYHFKIDNQKILFSGFKIENKSEDLFSDAFAEGISMLRRGRFDDGFKTLKDADNDGCMSFGCQKPTDKLQEDNVALAKRVGLELGKISKEFDKKNEYQKLLFLYEGYFQFCLDLDVFKGSPSKVVAEIVAKNAPKEFQQIVNDWGYYLWKAKDYPKAQMLLEAVIRLNPERAVAYLNLGDVRWDMGKMVEAKQAYIEYAKRVDQRRWPKYLKNRFQ